MPRVLESVSFLVVAVRAQWGKKPRACQRTSLSYLVVALLLQAAPSRAAPDTTIPEFVEKLPQPVQDAAQQMAESRDPPRRFLRGVHGIRRSRFGVGTSWQPDASPLYGVIPNVGKWGFVATGNLYTGYDWFGSERGAKRFMGRNNLSLSVLREHRKGELMLRAMLSFEPLTVGKRGYPLIAQTGAAADGMPIADRQHALEFFREVAASYTHEVSSHWALTLYVAASGEPALGPGAFTHRVSASADPLAPLGFQWQDATQTSNGVFTFGAFTRAFKLEASWFNGREPDERRYGIDLVRRPDSFAARVAWNPAEQLSTQLSYGFLKSPDRLAPALAHHRVSASLAYSDFRDDIGWATTLSLAERIKSNGHASFSGLLEGYWCLDGHHALFGRIELVQKSGAELVLASPTQTTHPVGTLVAGYVYYFGPFISLEPGLGLRASLSPLASALADDYGTRAPLGVMIYAQLRTAALPEKN